ncbi:leucyl/phenylalanyl-tRNA--protein transferase [Acidisoma sp. C75]
MHRMKRPDLTPDLLLRAYRVGLFPMAESRRDDRIYWLDPDLRGIIPLAGFHLPRRLRRTTLGPRFRVTTDRAFEAVLSQCADTADNRPDTWINPTIERLFLGLHAAGHAHSIECWEGDRLAGGLYGLAIGGAFFGESMFHRVRDASKVALVYLVALLRAQGFTLLDAQMVNQHLNQFGIEEVPRERYRAWLGQAVEVGAVWPQRIDESVLRPMIAAMGRDRE